MFVEGFVVKSPISLDEIIERPAYDIGQHFGRKPCPVEAAVANRKHKIARPKVSHTPYEILCELDNAAVGMHENGLERNNLFHKYYM